MASPAPSSPSPPPPEGKPAPKKQRTIQVKIGNAAARAMTPDQAADYLKSIASTGFGRELKMTFDNGSTSTVALPGGGSDGPAASAASLLLSQGAASGPAASASAAATRSSNNMPCTEKEMKALMSMFVEIMGLQMNTERLNRAPVKKKKKKTKEKEDGDGKKPKGSGNGRKLFSFPADVPPPPGGWPEDLSWPDGANDDDGGGGGGGSETDDDDGGSSTASSMPDLEDIPVQERSKYSVLLRELRRAERTEKAAEAAARRRRRLHPVVDHDDSEGEEGGPVTGTAGIAPFEWSALERSAIEDALEQEERIRKDAKADLRKTVAAKRQLAAETKKKEEAVLRKVAAVNKKLDRAVVTWRNRVAAAVQSNESDRLRELLAESPLRNSNIEKDVQLLRQQEEKGDAASQTVKALRKQLEQDVLKFQSPHVAFLVPHCLPRNRGSIDKGKETRRQLAAYILKDFGRNYMFELLRTGRSAVDTVSFYGDVDMMAQMFDGLTGEDKLLTPCRESGWTVLHYAALSGSLRTVEAVLVTMDDPGKLLEFTTLDTHTWRRSNGKGVTPRLLAETVARGTYEREIETHGMALQEIVKDYCLKSSRPSPERDVYLALTGRIAARLKDVEDNGYKPLDDKLVAREEEELKQTILRQHEAISSSGDDASSSMKKSKKKKKKKKNKSQEEEAAIAATSTESVASGAEESLSRASSSVPSSEAESKPPPESAEEEDDPMITALKGMGFSEEQIMEGISACGGTQRATADDVVAWIFGQQEEVSTVPSSSTRSGRKPPAAQDRKSAAAAASAKKKSRAQKREEAAQKREEAERRNREAAKRKEEERLAAEALAAKREEQRRRNREWNLRQHLEAQEKLAAAQPPRLHTGVGPFPTPAVAAGILPATASQVVAQGMSATAQKAGRATSDAAIDNKDSDDTSTIASSIIQAIEIGGNDDATVSTMGSFPLQPPAPSYAPPGFAAGGGLSESQHSKDPWDNAPRSISETFGHAPGSFAPLGSTGPSLGPPGIPESGPLLDHGHQKPPAVPGHAFDLGGRRSSAPGSFATGQGGLAVGGPSLLGGALVSNDTGANTLGRPTLFGGAPVNIQRRPDSGMGPSLLADSFDRRLSLNEGGTSISGGGGQAARFGGADFHRSLSQPPALDASIIDSISTAPSGIGGSTLWGDSSANGSSSLLANLINPNDQQGGLSQNAPIGSNLASLSSHGPNEQRAPGAGPTSWNQDRSNSLPPSGGGGGGAGGPIW